MDSKIYKMQSDPLPSKTLPPGVKEEHSIFQISLQRQSGLFPSWKSYKMILLESTKQQLLANIKSKKSQKVEESLDLTNCRLSNKMVKIDKHHCFGFIIASNKKYLIAGNSQQETEEIYNKIHYLRSRIRLGRSVPSKVEQSRQENHEVAEKEERDNLSFERGEERDKSESPQNPKNHLDDEEQEFIQDRIRDRVNEEELFRTAVLDVSPLENQQPRFQEKQLTLTMPISQKEISYLNSDEGFKLKSNFPQGRFLTAREQLIKVNLILSTPFSDQGLLESFFHLQLWNQRVKSYSLVNRIEQGIYLVKLELHRKNIISRMRYCYMMVSTCRAQDQLVVVFRSLEEEQFEPQIGYSWFSIDLWVKVQASEAESKLLTVCSSFKTARDFEIGFLFLEELKKYQLFLKTTGDLPRVTLEWRGQKKV